MSSGVGCPFFFAQNKLNLLEFVEAAGDKISLVSCSMAAERTYVGKSHEDLNFQVVKNF